MLSANRSIRIAPSLPACAWRASAAWYVCLKPSTSASESPARLSSRSSASPETRLTIPGTASVSSATSMAGCPRSNVSSNVVPERGKPMMKTGLFRPSCRACPGTCSISVSPERRSTFCHRLTFSAVKYCRRFSTNCRKLFLSIPLPLLISRDRSLALCAYRNAAAVSFSLSQIRVRRASLVLSPYLVQASAGSMAISSSDAFASSCAPPISASMPS